ncbi:MAG: DUF4361 domain-containing protein [Bacteroidales bacterium]|nr:DUF4361 domain-containing protein [Bacteroidales bacterium]
MKFKYIFLIASLISCYSCNEDEVFEKEQYKNLFALISGSENVLSKVVSLNKDETEGYISFSVGGTNPTKEDLVINIVEDVSFIDAYNKSNYDQSVAKYVKPLPQSKYDIESLVCRIPAGTISAQIPVKIRPEGLSPDSSYFISVRVDSYNAYEVNPDKNYLLYKINIKNKWATSSGTSYNLNGRSKQEGFSEISMPGTKVLQPLTKNSVRLMVGTEPFVSEVENFEKAAMVLEIQSDNKVIIRPYRDIAITQIDDDPDYPNVYKVDNDGYKTYKTFLLHYKYTLDNTNYEMREELRLQFDEADEKDEEE